VNGSATLLPLLLGVVALGIWGYSLLDFSRTDEADMLVLTRLGWVVVLVLGSVVGAVAWLTIGHRRRS
jgi:Phospholipase_D-nuclease N-terminal